MELTLAVGVLVAWGRIAVAGRAAAPQSRAAVRRRLSYGAWALGLALLTFVVMSLLDRWYGQAASWLVVFVAAVAAILVLRPALAPRIVPSVLILLGVGSFVMSRHYAGELWLSPPPRYMADEVSALGFTFGTTICRCAFGYGNYPVQSLARILLLFGYVFFLLGVGLTWRPAGPAAPRGRELAGRVAALPPRDRARALLLLPVAAMAAQFFIPSFYGRLPFAGWLALFLGPAVLVLHWWPGAATRIAAAGLVVLGVAGLAATAAFSYAGTPSAYGPLLLFGFNPDWVRVEAVVVLAGAAWLVPQAFPAVRRLLWRPALPDPELQKRVEELAESRAEVVDTAARDLRRLERDLHDGAQVRLVALGMNLRAAERLIPGSPDAAIALVAEAREASARALTELRELVRGVHPPVLADRGLAGAVQALALDCPLAVQTHVDLPGRLPAPVETACYFAVAELLANAAKHSGARDAQVDVSHDGRVLRVEVSDFGLGGADIAAGTGLAGVEKRLAAFDGIMAVTSPPGGPTVVILEVPCTLAPAEGSGELTGTPAASWRARSSGRPSARTAHCDSGTEVGPGRSRQRVRCRKSSRAASSGGTRLRDRDRYPGTIASARCPAGPSARAGA